MTRPRKELISLDDTPYYHITSRCVRRAFLCGVDEHSGQCYEHRRQWIEDRIRLLSSLFAIDICAYAVMSNHYHLVLKVSPKQLDMCSDDDVMDRWCSLFKGPLLVQRLRAGQSLSTPERDTVSDIVKTWRHKLSSISWFMRCLNQPIAFQANREDNCRGKFWESRFTSQALKTEGALLSCMAYVDLNPVRAGMAETPETSDHTSIKERITLTFDFAKAIKEQTGQDELIAFNTDGKPLLHFDEALTHHEQRGIPFSFNDYIALVDWTGRAIREDKRGAIDDTLPPILHRLNITSKQWLINTTQFEIAHRKQSMQRKKAINSS